MPAWVGIAAKHLDDALAAEAARNAAWASGDEDLKYASLEKEFTASMQCIMATAIALDAFYAVIRPKVTSITDELIAVWKQKKTARHAQVAEVTRQAFRLKPDDAKRLKAALRDMFRLRDTAVHPHGDMRAPLFHPDLNVHIESRFVCFRAANAKICVQNLKGIVIDLATQGQPSNPEIASYAQALAGQLTSQATPL